MKRILLPLAAAVMGLALLLSVLPASGSLHASGAPLNLSTTPGDSRNPALAVGDDSSRHVVWEETVAYSPTLSLQQLWHREWTGAAWTAAISVSTGVEPALAVGPDAKAHLAWSDTFSGTDQIFYSQWNGSGWAVPKLIAPGLSGNATAPVVAVDSSNTVYAAWGQFSSGSFTLYYASSAAGGSGPWSALPVPNASGDAPAIALAPDGTLHLAWQQAVTATHGIYYAALSNGSWSLAENISQAPGVDSLNPSLALAANGRPLVVWSAAPGSQYEVLSSLRGSLGWSTPVNVSNSPDNSLRPRIIRAAHDSVVMWNEGTIPGSIDWAFGTNGAWTHARTLVSGGGDWGDVAPAAGRDGAVHVAYDGGPNPNGDVFYDALALSHLYLPFVVR